MKFKNQPGYQPVRRQDRNGVLSTKWIYVGPGPTLAARPGIWDRAVAMWRKREAVRDGLKRAALWYSSVGVEPDPPRNKEPLSRTAAERQAIRVRYDAWLALNGFDPHTGLNADGFDPWGGHPSLRQDPKRLVHPLTGKPWSPTGFLQDGTHARTGTFYDEDGVDRRGFFPPNAQGERIHIGTGTIFSLADPARTWDGDTVEQHFVKHREWRTPEIDAEIRAARAETEAAGAVLRSHRTEEERVARKMQRMGLI